MNVILRRWILGLVRNVSVSWLRINREFLIVFLSFLVQISLAIFLGHYYDTKVSMATGFLVASGRNPYQQFDVSNVFPNPLLGGVAPIIGYPPLWPLFLGLAFRLSYGIIPNLFLYNFAIKIPIIVGNIGLAYMVKSLLGKLNAPVKKTRMAWLFLLFNPFILLTTAAWGQFDTIVALLCVASLYFLSKGRSEECALTLALSVALKPITLPLIGLPFLFSSAETPRKNLRYLLFFVAFLFAFLIAPFYLLGWSRPFTSDELTAHFRMAGGMTPFNLVEIFQNAFTLPAGFELLGYLWLPAVMVGYYAVYRKRPTSMNELVLAAVGLILIFFLTRSWLSEPNINLVLPLLVIAVALSKLDWRSLQLSWIVPLVFMFLNVAFAQLFFLLYPSVLESIVNFDLQFGGYRLVASVVVTLVWAILAWRIADKVLGRRPKER